MRATFYRVSGFKQPPQQIGSVTLDDGHAHIPDALQPLIDSATIPVPPDQGEAYLDALCQVFSGSYLWARNDNAPTA